MSRDNNYSAYTKSAGDAENFTPDTSGVPPLSSQVIRGGIWVFTLRIIEKLLRFIRIIILARLLAPDDFGLFGIALLSMSCLEKFSETGFEHALIQKKQDISQYLDTAWTAQLIRAAILACILFITAPAIGLFFNNPQAIILTRAIALAVLLKGLANIGVIYFKKELKFNKQFAYRSIGIVVEFIVAVSLAIILKNAWALLFGLLANYFVTFLVSYIIHPYRPKLALDIKKFKELFSFGKWVLGSGILLFLYTQGDDIFVGKLLGVTALGLYQMAYRISNMPATEITHAISQVTFPAYSKLQEELTRLRKAYLRILMFTTAISVPIAGGIIFLAPDFTRLFLGQKWVQMVPAMQVLAMWGMIRSIGANSGPLFRAIGRPDLGTKLQTAKLILLAILIYPLTVRLGILGTSYAVLLNALVVFPIGSYLAIKITKCKTSEFIKSAGVPVLITSIMLGVLFFFKHAVFAKIDFIEFFILGIIGVVVYLCLVLVAEKYFSYGIKEAFHRKIKEIM